MNRYVASLLVCFLLLASSFLPFSDVAARPAPAIGGSDQIIVTAADEGSQVELREGQILAVTLRANPSTGYQWAVAQAEGTILQEVGEPEFEADSPLLGAPGTITRHFEAVAAGTTDLVLVYRRPWEEAEPAQSLSLEVQAVGPFLPASSRPAPTPTPPPDPEPEIQSPPDAKGQSVGALLSAFDWCDRGGCTPVRDQGSCGSCWAFGTVALLESQIRLQDGRSKNLSEQYLLSCNTEGYDCDGGWFVHDYHWWKRPPGEPEAGAVYEADFPYVARAVACNPPHTHHEKIRGWAYVGSARGVPPVADIKQAIYDHGPVASAICVNDAFQLYRGGVFSGPGCTRVNHGVVLVGWDDSKGAGGAWRVKNSWSPYWGESGYMWIAYGVSQVGYAANYVMYGSRPNAPSNLQATAVSSMSIRLRWLDNSSNESIFKIERSPNGSTGWTQIATVGAGVTAYTNTGLSPRTTYYYRVRAYNAAGNSSYSNVAQATTLRRPDRPGLMLHIPLALRNAR